MSIFENIKSNFICYFLLFVIIFFEAIEFSELLQDLLRETQKIYNPNMLNIKSRENFLKY